MRKKEIIWIGLLVLLCGVYARYFTTWFVHRQITINASPRPSRQADAAVYPIFFSWNEDLRLTRVKVIPWEGDNFNPKGHPVWDLVSDSNSVPIRAFHYGQHIEGMKPALKGVHPNPLEPDMAYRLIISAGELTGYKDFRTQATGQ